METSVARLTPCYAFFSMNRINKKITVHGGMNFEKKFVFIHIPRTGGTSVRKSLRLSIDPKYDGKLEEISPEVARSYLELNYKNREINNQKVEELRREIVEGRWQFDGNPIVFDQAGRLRNGQHRLTAICRAGLTVEILVARGIEEGRLVRFGYPVPFPTPHLNGADLYAPFKAPKVLYGVKHAPWVFYADARPRDFKRFFKFSFVRNPWDRTLSAYFHFLRVRPENHWAKKRRRYSGHGKPSSWVVKTEIIDGSFQKTKEDFQKFVRTKLEDFSRRVTLSLPQVYYIGKKPVVDFLGRFESLEEDYLKICDKIDVAPSAEFPHWLKSDREEDFREYYDNETMEIVSKVYADDIKTLGYQFD